MTDQNPDDPQGSYSGPPATEQFGALQPQYPTTQYPQPYPQPPYPAYGQQYGYGAPPGYGYPPPPGYAYPMPYSPAPTGPRRPGLVVASAVLGYINAGLLILAGALLLFGAAIVSDFEDAVDSGTDYGTEFALDGFVNLVAAGLLIAGAVMFSGRRPVGRLLLVIGNGIVIAATVYWLVRFSDDRFNTANSGYVVWSVLFAALAVLPLAFAFVSDVTRWLNADREV